MSEGSEGKVVLITGGSTGLGASEIRGQSLAINNAAIALIGLLIGPPIIGWAIDGGDSKAIGMVLFGYVLVVGIPSLILVVAGLKHYRKEIDVLETTLRSTAAP